MEGNRCYKFATIRNYVDLIQAPPVRLTIDIGANLGAITRMIKAYFPAATVYAYEAVSEYANAARANVNDLSNVSVIHAAVTGEHLYLDDFGDAQRAAAIQMRVLKGTPAAGPGWVGGSCVVASDSQAVTSGAPAGYALTDEQVTAVSLDDVVADVLTREHRDCVDVLKLDCEGCEHSVLGTAAMDTLSRIRFIVGEYHQIERFYCVMIARLYRTHKVNLVGDRNLGAFFAERLDGTADGILRYDKTGMLTARPWLSPRPIDWHLFNDRYIPPGERRWHGLP
jgi:FkbM family methyltransferase